ncbi:hypothetical protein RhiLY_00113 [Ceratobasidium sp. AG-Ba]|nr:hypothetical protein RhiLY_00113 [Ceratobasidium sp. AG-Ba]
MVPCPVLFTADSPSNTHLSPESLAKNLRTTRWSSGSCCILQTAEKQDFDRIMGEKITALVDLLYRRKIEDFLDYLRVIWSDNKPDYAYLSELFRNLFVYNSYRRRYVFNQKLLGLNR